MRNGIDYSQISFLMGAAWCETSWALATEHLRRFAKFLLYKSRPSTFCIVREMRTPEVRQGVINIPA